VRARLEQSRDKPPTDVSSHPGDKDVRRSAFGAQRLAFSVHGSPFAVVYNKNHENTYIYKTKKTETMPESLRPMNGELRTLTAPPNVVASRSGHGYFAGTYGS
jgi:hypothetical protein